MIFFREMRRALRFALLPYYQRYLNKVTTVTLVTYEHYVFLHKIII